MKIPSAPASFRTRSDSSSSSVQLNLVVARPAPDFVNPDEPLYLLLSSNQAPVFLPEPVPNLSSYFSSEFHQALFRLRSIQNRSRPARSSAPAPAGQRCPH